MNKGRANCLGVSVNTFNEVWGVQVSQALGERMVGGGVIQTCVQAASGT